MMDPRSRPLSRAHGPAAAGTTAPAYPLTDLPVEMPLDSRPASEPSPEGAAEELVDPEKLLLSSEHSQPRSSLAAGPIAQASPQHRSSALAPAPVPPPASGAAELMDRDFIARNQVVERYLSGRLPIKGATDFERFCRENPELLDELGIPERVNAALRLLEAGGKPEPWTEPPQRFWQKPGIIIGLLAASLVLAIALAIVGSGSVQKSGRIAALRQEATERPLEPAASTRDIRLLPSRDGASDTPAILIGGGREAQLVDFRIDESRSAYRLFRITIDRIDQGRVGIIDHLAKDSDGDLRIALNTTALGPGNYQLTIEGLDWQGRPQPDSWVTIGIRAPQ
ncbi:MAG TPA: hypothetical protein VND24_04215 [Steroidobacteraceae bacterium]|nr:hypothetical protein [Steroidobacteraceae bacterium]